MQEPYEESLVKIDAVISGIRMINLNIFNHLNEYINPRQKDFRENKEKDPRQ